MVEFKWKTVKPDVGGYYEEVAEVQHIVDRYPYRQRGCHRPADGKGEYHERDKREVLSLGEVVDQYRQERNQQVKHYEPAGEPTVHVLDHKQFANQVADAEILLSGKDEYAEYHQVVKQDLGDEFKEFLEAYA